MARAPAPGRPREQALADEWPGTAAVSNAAQQLLEQQQRMLSYGLGYSMAPWMLYNAGFPAVPAPPGWLPPQLQPQPWPAQPSWQQWQQPPKPPQPPQPPQQPPKPAQPPAQERPGADAEVQQCFKALRERFPQLTTSMRAMVLPALLLGGGAASEGRRGPVARSRLAGVTQALERGQAWALETVEAFITQCKQRYLQGEPLGLAEGVSVAGGQAGSPARLPQVAAQDAEEAMQELLLRPEAALPRQEQRGMPQGQAPPARLAGSPTSVPEAAAKFLEGGGLLELHKAALQDLPALFSQQLDASLSAPSMDFGVVKLKGAGEAPAADGGPDPVSLPALAAALGGRKAEWEHDSLYHQGARSDQASRVRLRQLCLRTKAQPATLIDVRAYPAFPLTFALADDCGVCRGPHPNSGDPAVALSAGAEYAATVLLDRLDGPHRRRETGLLQQMVLFTLLTPDPAALASPLCRRLPNSSLAVAVLGCRLSVALTAQAGELQRLLDPEAKPYVSQHLRTLFDRPPRAYHAIPPPLQPMFKARRLVGSINAWQAAEVGASLPPPSAHTTVGAARTRRRLGGAPAEAAAAAGGCAKQALLYAHLLQLEEAAMEDQIRRYDLFNVRFQLALIAGTGKRYRLLSPQPAAGEPGPPKLFRGPRLAKLLLPKLPPALLVLDVPGLPEDRPAVVFGDAVYVRFACADLTEFAGSVVATQGTSCFLAMPPEFLACCPGLPGQDGSQVRRVLGEAAGTAEQRSLVHARFSFDRSRMQWMQDALTAAANSEGFQMLPDVSTEAPTGLVQAGLPSSKEFAAALSTGRNGAHKGVARVLAAKGKAEKQAGPTLARVQKTADSIREVASKRLNAEQRRAVAAFLEDAGSGRPFTLFGPPGTGKTVTLAECCLQVLQRCPGARLLVCAPQGYSADLVASALGAAGLKRRQLLRLADPRQPPAQMKQDVLDGFARVDDALGAFALPPPAEVAAARVVVSTCVGAGLLRHGEYRQYHATCKAGRQQPGQLVGLEFSHVLIDEAGQAIVPEALVPLSLLQPRHGRVMLCGDPKQLGPVVRSLPAAAGVGGTGLAKSLLECFIQQNAADAPARLAAGLAPATGTLVANYRSHSSLLAVPNALFYEQALVAAADQAALQPPAWSELRAEAGNAVEAAAAEGRLPSTLFYGVRGQQMREGEAPSYFNPIEASTLVELLAGLLQQKAAGVTIPDIAVIATYRKQVQKLRLLLRARGLGFVRVGTVDDLQGQEARVIFISTVLSRPESLPRQEPGREQAPGFWRNPRRFNVAITRAKALLVVLGHPAVLVEDPSWRSLMRFCASRGAYRGAGSATVRRLLQAEAESGECDGSDGGSEGGKADGGGGVTAAIEQLAEMALLGAGCAAQMYPESADDVYAAHSEEVQWRVAL